MMMSISQGFTDKYNNDTDRASCEGSLVKQMALTYHEDITDGDELRHEDKRLLESLRVNLNLWKVVPVR